jgi:hypothetical protein
MKVFLLQHLIFLQHTATFAGKINESLIYVVIWVNCREILIMPEVKLCCAKNAAEMIKRQLTAISLLYLNLVIMLCKKFTCQM